MIHFSFCLYTYTVYLTIITFVLYLSMSDHVAFQMFPVDYIATDDVFDFVIQEMILIYCHVSV